MTTLSGLVAIRLSHELAGPIGAVSAGVEMLGGEDAEVRDLIADSVATLVATLKLHRFVLAPPTTDDAARTGHALLAAWLATREQLTLDWQVTPGRFDTRRMAILLGLGMCAAEAAPRGGSLLVADEAVVVASSQIVLDGDVAAALRGTPVTKSRAALAGIIRAAADEQGLELLVRQEPAGLSLGAYQGKALPR